MDIYPPFIFMIEQTFSSEKKLNTPEQQKCWQQVSHHKFTAADGVAIAYCQLLQDDRKKAIVISNGRIESYLKYQETIYDLYQQGFSVFALDHRGQGLSDRLTENPHQGHVNQFADYVSDFAEFIETVVLPTEHQSMAILAHSMGGAIATHYLHQHPNVFDCAVLSSPMFGIVLPLNNKAVLWLAKRLDKTTQGKEKVISNYVLGGGITKQIPLLVITYAKASFAMSTFENFIANNLNYN